jgi:tyrosine-protein phosphatase SIW14
MGRLRHAAYCQLNIANNLLVGRQCRLGSQQGLPISGERVRHSRFPWLAQFSGTPHWHPKPDPGTIGSLLLSGMEADRMIRAIRFLLGLGVLSVIVGVPAGYAAYRNANLRNFGVVKPGVLYRSGQLSQSGLERVIHDHGIRTVVTLRDAVVEGERPPDWREEKYCRDQDIKYVRLRPREWHAELPGEPVPAEAGLKKFLEVMDDPANYPVLVHCLAGIHRTGAYMAVYRMEMDRWDNEAALDELRACGYRHLDDEWDVLGYLESYRPRWKK